MGISRAFSLLQQPSRAWEIFRCARETPRWAGVASAVLEISHPAYPSVVPLRRGRPIPIENLSDLKTFWQVFARHVYRVNRSDMVILDVGANIGLFTLYAARHAPAAKIVAVEPFPSTFERLQQTVRDHGLGDQVTCLNLAVTGDSGTYRMRDVPMPSQQRQVIPPKQDGAGIQVRGVTLTELMQECHLDGIDLLKMDIEGGEYPALLATPVQVLGTIRRIALEYHGHCLPYTKQQLFSHLSEAGFQITSDAQNDKGYGLAEAVATGPSLSAAGNVVA
ncbi:MAG TPA: FkbM family methyltransferase [Candidatus Sulfotelmatobacter sp.]